MNRFLKMLAIASIYLALAAIGSPVRAEDQSNGDWPQEIQASGYTIVVYQPQPEKLVDNNLSARTALSVEPTGSNQPVFGAVWFEAQLQTDRTDRMAGIESVKILRIRFPEGDEEKNKKLAALLEREMPKWDVRFSLDQLASSLETAEVRAREAQNLNNDPPVIIFMDQPAVLVIIDGEPRLQKEENTSLMRVINIPFTILLEGKTKTYYLFADKKTWYSARDVRGPWAPAQSVPGEVAARAPKEDPEDNEDGAVKTDKPGPPPKVVVSFEPTELISTTGKPQYSPVAGTDLLYMSNTDSDVLMNIKTQEYFVLLAGRWYTSKSLNGPWKYTKGDNLPKDFAKIPETSDMNTVRYAVPGTEEAKDAVLDAYIPQTAAVDRTKADLAVKYDGSPVFRPIGSTPMTYAVNTPTPVIWAEGRYYACDQGIWFTANTPTGPWVAAASIPQVIYTIPPDSPLYNVTYVRVYRATPQVIYVGYTPGYTNTYIYNGTIVYGTGYYYEPWYGRYYCPRPFTWGFHVRWNPWAGWGFGFSYGSGPFSFSYGYGGWYWGGWWGPRRHYHYRHGYRRGYRHGYRHGHRHGYRRPGRRPGGSLDIRPGGSPRTRDNLYRNRANIGRIKPVGPSRNRPDRIGSRPINRRNDVYVDRGGSIHRRTDQGWQRRDKNNWRLETKPAPGNRPSNRVTIDRNNNNRINVDRNRNNRINADRNSNNRIRPDRDRARINRSGVDRRNLDRTYRSRQRGQTRARQFRPEGGASRGPAGGRGRR